MSKSKKSAVDRRRFLRGAAVGAAALATQAAVKALGAIDVRNRDDHDLELRVERWRFLGIAHVVLLGFGGLESGTSFVARE